MEHILKLEQVKKYYGGAAGNITKAVDGISMEVNKGEFTAIMGASGSGKTTLLNCISTIDTVTAGHITVNHQDITKIKEKDFDILLTVGAGNIDTLYDPIMNWIGTLK